jgi:transforming growth factor-beta-induced protein
MRRTLAFLAAAVVVAAPAATTATASPAAGPNVVQVAVKAGSFKTLVALVKQAGLAGALSTKTVTVFAPTDAAFAKVPKATLMKLQADPALLKKVLLYHVVAGRVPAAKVAGLKSVKTLEGAPLAIRVSGSTVRVGGATVVKANVPARNGVIHVIDRVLIPPVS